MEEQARDEGQKLIQLSTSIIIWVGPPPTNSGILGIYKDLNIVTISSCGH